MIDINSLNKSIFEIVLEVKQKLNNGKLSRVEMSGLHEVRVTCPVHSEGQERRPSCFINIETGVFHCFTCGESGYFDKFIALCFDKTVRWAEKWLKDNYTTPDSLEYKQQIRLDRIYLKDKIEHTYLDESILNTYQSYHPYMSQRHLTDEVIKKFDIKYDPKTDCLIFPVRDYVGKLVALTMRSVKYKYFNLGAHFNKSNIYLLNYNKYEPKVYVVESQINALTLESWGYKAIALFGAGTTKEQMNILNKTNIQQFVLCYDNDAAGRKGAKRFKSLIDDSHFVQDIIMPEGKDVNDLTKEEFDNLVYSQSKKVYINNVEDI